MIVYTIEPSQPEYLPQEEILLNLAIENKGATPVRVPDAAKMSNSEPTFEIQRVAETEGEKATSPVTTSNWIARNGAAHPPPMTLLPLAPGTKWEGSVRMNRLAPMLEAPGTYQIESRVTVETAQVRAPQRAIRINRPDPASFNLAQGLRPLNHGQGELAFLQKEKTTRGVYLARVDENEPANSEVTVGRLMRRATAAANATDILTPSSNAGLFADLLQWLVWREGATIKSLSSAETEPLSVQLSQEPDYLVKPALTQQGGTVDILAIKGKSLSLISIPRELFTPGVQKWTAELPVSPTSITAAIAPPEIGGHQYVVFAAAGDNFFDLYCARFSGDALGQIAKIRIGDGTLLAHTPIAASVTANGKIHVAALRSGVEPGRNLAWIEAEFGGADGGAEFTARDLPALEKPVERGALLLVTLNGAIIRRDLALFSDKQMWSLTGMGTWARIPHKPAFPSPITLLAGKELSYVLFQNDKGAFHFQPLNR